MRKNLHPDSFRRKFGIWDEASTSQPRLKLARMRKAKHLRRSQLVWHSRSTAWSRARCGAPPGHRRPATAFLCLTHRLAQTLSLTHASRAAQIVIDGVAGVGYLVNALRGWREIQDAHLAALTEVIVAHAMVDQAVIGKDPPTATSLSLTQQVLSCTRRKIGNRGGFGWQAAEGGSVTSLKQPLGRPRYPTKPRKKAGNHSMSFHLCLRLKRSTRFTEAELALISKMQEQLTARSHATACVRTTTSDWPEGPGNPAAEEYRLGPGLARKDRGRAR